MAQNYTRMNGGAGIKQPETYGLDPLEGRVDLQQIRKVRYRERFPNDGSIFESVISEYTFVTLCMIETQHFIFCIPVSVAKVRSDSVDSPVEKLSQEQWKEQKNKILLIPTPGKIADLSKVLNRTNQTPT